LMHKLEDKHHFLTRSEINIINSNNKNSINLLSKLDKILDSIPLFIPEYPTRISSYFGMRKHPVSGCKKFHCGLDFVTNKSGPVYAVASGMVSRANYSDSYGKIVEIKHQNRFKTKYAHLKKIMVNLGDKVIRGQQIGVQGATGKVTGEHLHFEVYLNNKLIDPLDFILHGK
jgi:murein DD-endopeptidase MepM/ murein hydrolase activator NlpD